MSKKAFPIFNHSDLDDYGLDPFEFRIYSRIARRAGKGGATESISRMAEGTQMSDRKARYAVALLLKARLVEKKDRSGRSSIFVLTPKEHWAPKRLLSELRCEVMGKQSGKRAGSTSDELLEQDSSKDAGRRCQPPMQGVPIPSASDAGPLESPPPNDSPDEEKINIITSPTEADVFNEQLIARLQADPAYKHLDVAHVIAKMLAHCIRTGKIPTLARLEHWLHREWDHPRYSSKRQMKTQHLEGAIEHARSEKKTETASERNARLRIESFDLLTES